MEISPAQQDVKEKLAEELSKIRMGRSTRSLLHQQRVERSLKKEEREISEKMDTSVGVSVVDIDSNIKDPQLCSFYAPDIYNIICAKELDRKAFN
ncbi:hypothetical protein OIU84_000271 [Salix udensis]|uniref:Uncharacterized protein n=1 Tax=Salix udensis TaxID=889485 RepID=A0AAD6PMY4_9ROSI|nr:hypothetical protein OIU84_000271 [Salix udensis]